MATKKTLNDDAFVLKIGQLTEVLQILGYSYNEFGDFIYGLNNKPGKLYHFCWQRIDIPIRIVNSLIKLVGERAYRIAWERMISYPWNRPKQNPTPMESIAEKEKVKIEKPDKTREVLLETIKPVSAKHDENNKIVQPEVIVVVKKKRRYKRRVKETDNSPLKIEIESKKITEKPVAPEKQEIKKIESENKKNIKDSVFYKIGKPLSEFNVKK